MGKRAGSLCILLLTAILVFLTGGCTFTHTLHAEPSYDKLPSIEKIPITAGVYYSPQFRAYSHTRIFGPHKYVAPIGADSVVIFNKILPLVFGKVTPVNSLPPYRANAPNVDLVLEPAIEHFNFLLGMDSLSEDKSIVYRFTLYDLDGSPIDSWAIRGQPENESRWTTPFGHLDDDVEDAIVKFMNRFSGEEPIRTKISQSLQKDHKKQLTQTRSLQEAIVTATPVLENIKVGDETKVLNDYGVVVIDLVIENVSDKSLTADVSTFRLSISEGNKIAPSDTSALFSRLEKRSYSGDVTSFFLGPIISTAVVIAEDVHKDTIQKDIKAQLDQKLMVSNISLAPGQKVSGLLLFVPPIEMGSFSKAKLSLWLKDESQYQLQRIVDLDNIGYKSIKLTPSN
ncbi:MAG: hypothetical protein EHM38_09505 [Geobacteraceae bacterium]|nr:MAG: hypothetical protein EHM38_09505 [Geobacteraceae bacterium]